MLKKLLGINWKTTLPGILVIFGLITKIGAALRTKDFGTVFTSAQELIPDVIALLMGIGLIAAKASDVTGVGTQAAKVTETGKLVTADDKIIGTQPSA